MPNDVVYPAYHFALMMLSGSMCLVGTWVGMRHFARARATDGGVRYGWLFMASVGTGAALWASIFISVVALQPDEFTTFDLAPSAAVLVIGIIACLAGFEIGSRRGIVLAPEMGGLVLGVGVIAMHAVAVIAWHANGAVEWNRFGVSATAILGLGLSALSVNRANRPVTRYCKHGAAIVMTFMICIMHLALFASLHIDQGPGVQLSSDMIAAQVLTGGVVCAILLLIGSGFSSYVIDLRTRTDSADRIYQLSFNDSMTGLPNRVAFNERLAFDAAEAHERAHSLAAFSIDIDGFKDVNDVFGHSAGDLLLIAAAERMRQKLAPGEFLARQSGDEFIGLQMSGNHPLDALAFAQRVAAAFAEPFTIQGQAVTLSASIGFALFPTDSPERDQLLSNAKLAMYRGKSRQRGQICAYHREMDDAARARRALARDIQAATERSELELHYQLQFALADGAVIGTEALMRWRHPARGLVSPADFIPLAEETEAIFAMGEWALRTACRDAAEGRLPGMVAVNLSPIQFKQQNLTQIVHGILIETGLSPSRLEVEVTESALLSDQAGSIHILRQLKAMGVSIAMDDFGTGYSSLATLHTFPFDKIKLDQSFVKRLPTDASAAAIVRTILALGTSLGVPVLAEGIENAAQLAFLKDAGCAKGQGFLFAKPVPCDLLPDALRAMTTCQLKQDEFGALRPSLISMSA